MEINFHLRRSEHEKRVWAPRLPERRPATLCPPLARANLAPCRKSARPIARHEQFVYAQSVYAADGIDIAASRIAAAIGEPARARMLYSLMDGHARTSTELAVVAEVSPSTASAHLSRLAAERLVQVVKQGKHRYYSLHGSSVAGVLEGLSVLAGGPATGSKFVPSTPSRLRVARTCYDHLAGTVAVSLHDRFQALGWLLADSMGGADSYALTPDGMRGFEALGIDTEASRGQRRRFACACVDWSERQPHVGGSLGAAILKIALKRRWVTRELDSRALNVTTLGRREMLALLGLSV